MVKVAIKSSSIHFSVEGWDRLWALKSELEIPLSHVTSVRADPEPARGWWHGVRMPGTQIPGVITAGTFYQHGRAVFYDVHDPERTIVLELDHEHYSQLIMEVEDPAAAVAAIDAALHRPSAAR